MRIQRGVKIAVICVLLIGMIFVMTGCKLGHWGDLEETEGSKVIKRAYIRTGPETVITVEVEGYSLGSAGTVALTTIDGKRYITGEQNVVIEEERVYDHR